MCLLNLLGPVEFSSFRIIRCCYCIGEVLPTIRSTIFAPAAPQIIQAAANTNAGAAAEDGAAAATERAGLDLAPATEEEEAAAEAAPAPAACRPDGRVSVSLVLFALVCVSNLLKAVVPF